MSALLATVLLSSLAGSVHCAGMCGGLAAVAAGGDARGGRLGALAAYNGGRLAAYSALGALAGGLGAGLDLAGPLVGVQRLAALAAGAAIVAWGALALARSLGARLPRLVGPRPGGAWLAAILRRAGRGHRARRALAIGVLTGLLPCGWLWAFLATAAGTGTWAAGAALMSVFWLGTVPVMAGLGAGLGSVLGPLRRHAPAVSAVALIVVGLLAVLGRGAAVAPPPTGASSLREPTPAASARHEHR